VMNGAYEQRPVEVLRLLRLALHLRMYGENAPGGNETWCQFDRECEVYLRSIDDAFYLGCDECSETVKILTPDEAINLMEIGRAQ
jgi:hypothetical protein